MELLMANSVFSERALLLSKLTHLIQSLSHLHWQQGALQRAGSIQLRGKSRRPTHNTPQGSTTTTTANHKHRVPRHKNRTQTKCTRTTSKHPSAIPPDTTIEQNADNSWTSKQAVTNQETALKAWCPNWRQPKLSPSNKARLGRPEEGKVPT